MTGLPLPKPVFYALGGLFAVALVGMGIAYLFGWRF